MGDFNINLFNSDTHNPTSEFITTMYSKNLFPFIRTLTRITTHSPTLIDNIFTNNLADRYTFQNSILFTDITDHLQIFHIIKMTNKTTHKKVITKRLIIDERIEKVNEQLQ